MKNQKLRIAKSVYPEKEWGFNEIVENFRSQLAPQNPAREFIPSRSHYSILSLLRQIKK